MVWSHVHNVLLLFSYNHASIFGSQYWTMLLLPIEFGSSLIHNATLLANLPTIPRIPTSALLLNIMQLGSTPLTPALPQIKNARSDLHPFSCIYWPRVAYQADRLLFQLIDLASHPSPSVAPLLQSHESTLISATWPEASLPSLPQLSSPSSHTKRVSSDPLQTPLAVGQLGGAWLGCSRPPSDWYPADTSPISRWPCLLSLYLKGTN